MCISDTVEGFASLNCHVIVRQSSEVIDLADRPSTEAGEVTARGAAFLRLAEEHLDRSYRLARAILRDPGEAEDATHDAYLQAWQKWSTLREPARFEQWFSRILVNTCRNRLRLRRARTTDISTEVALATGDAFGATHDHDEVASAISALSPDHRVVVALRYYEDLGVADIAKRLGIPEGTVQSRLHYALKRLRATMDPADDDKESFR
jgi:RNA polymerase sigma-70 factor, ECF subfamily